MILRQSFFQRCARDLVTVITPIVLTWTASHQVFDDAIERSLVKIFLWHRLILDAIALAARQALGKASDQCRPRSALEFFNQRHGISRPAEEISPHSPFGIRRLVRRQRDSFAPFQSPQELLDTFEVSGGH